jgi:hypothetical protein
VGVPRELGATALLRSPLPADATTGGPRRTLLDGGDGARSTTSLPDPTRGKGMPARLSRSSASCTASSSVNSRSGGGKPSTVGRPRSRGKPTEAAAGRDVPCLRVYSALMARTRLWKVGADTVRMVERRIRLPVRASSPRIDSVSLARRRTSDHSRSRQKGHSRHSSPRKRVPPRATMPTTMPITKPVGRSALSEKAWIVSLGPGGRAVSLLPLLCSTRATLPRSAAIQSICGLTLIAGGLSPELRVEHCAAVPVPEHNPRSGCAALRSAAPRAKQASTLTAARRVEVDMFLLERTPRDAAIGCIRLEVAGG